MNKTVKTLYLLPVLVFALTAAAPSASQAKPKGYPTPGTVADRANPRPDQENWSYNPFLPTYKERQNAYVKLTADRDKGGLFGAAARAMLGQKGDPVSEGTIAAYEKTLADRNDCADFSAIRVVMAVYLNDRDPFLAPEQFERLKKALINFKYWVDEPGPDKMISWTENHQILFHAIEYLAGQRFPDDIFTNNGKTGAWHRDHAKPLAIQWAERRAKWGFSEWDSNVYYSEDLPAIASLAEYAAEPDMAAAASIATDILLLDTGSDLFHGYRATSQGRAYDEDILSGRDYSMTATIKLVFGLGIFADAGRMDTFSLASSRRYIPSAAIIAAGQDDAPGYQNRERHGIPLEKFKQYGLDYKSLSDAPTMWGMGAYTNPPVLDLFIRAADEWNLWQHPFLAELGDMTKAIPRNGKLGAAMRSVEIESNRTLLGEVNKISYRTPLYMLSSAQSYRPGGSGNQHHIWQGTLSPDALVFTTNPGSDEINSDRTPDYWAGHNRLPQVTQYKNLAIILYNINTAKAMGERNVYKFTHAFFPKWAFDETSETNGWLFGRVGDGYLALYSSHPYKWKDAGEEFAHDVIVDGVRNVWICLMGDKPGYGSFEDFKAKTLAAPLKIDDLDVTFDAPGVGAAAVSWKGPFTVDGKEIPLSGYPLFDSPFAHSDFDSGVITVDAGGERLTLDFPKLTRMSEKR